MPNHVSYSELRDFRQCPLKHRLAWVEKWTPVETPPALSKGRAWHEILAAHYQALKDGVSPNEAVQSIVAAINDDELRSLMEWMYEGYVETYGADEQWKILAVEETHEVWLKTDTGHRSGYRLKIRLDLLAADRMGRLWLTDHKSAGRFPNETSLDLQDQDSLYQWALQELGVNVHGVCYNICRTQRNKSPMKLEDRFKRVYMYRTETQLRNTALDAWRTAKRMATIKHPERTTDAELCMRMCSFTEPCLFGRKGGDLDEFLIAKGYARRNGH